MKWIEKQELLLIMNENLEATKRAKEKDWYGIFETNNIFDAVIETYDDLISIIENLPLKRDESPSPPLPDLEKWIGEFERAIKFVPQFSHENYLKVMAAMDEYAKQEAIGFAKFADNNYFRLGDTDRWTDKPYEEDGKEFTSEQLYNLYLQSKNQQTEVK